MISMNIFHRLIESYSLKMTNKNDLQADKDIGYIVILIDVSSMLNIYCANFQR